jgi:cyclophilin family peptidyl-prolyl cis-trans isomerase
MTHLNQHRSWAALALSLSLLTPWGAQAQNASAPQTTITPKVRISTSMGDIEAELYADKAPKTVANFLQYVSEKHYEGTIFHRVIPGFMLQGGGYDGQYREKKTRAPVVHEGRQALAAGLKNTTGTLAMARTNDPNSAKAQFFINVQDNPMLDYPNNGGYAVFGSVVEGMDVVDKIKSTSTGIGKMKMLHPATGEAIEMPAENVPNTAVTILSATLE